MTTTCMRNSSVGDAWIQEACALNPIRNMGDSTFLTCPVRVSFPQLFTPKAYTGPDGKQQAPKYSVSVLFPPFADLREMQEEMIRLAAQKWPESYVGGQLYGVPIPLRDQGERGNKEGYTPGLKFFNASSEGRPHIYGKPPAMQPLTSPESVYAGCWGLVSVRFYAAKGAKRVAAGLNGMTLYGDDTRLGGGGPSPDQVRNQFSGVRMGTPVAVPANMGQAMASAPQPGYSAPMSNEDIIRQLMGN